MRVTAPTASDEPGARPLGSARMQVRSTARPQWASLQTVGKTLARRDAKQGGVQLPVCPPLEPMLGRLARELPVGGYVYEPKWDGFRCLAFRDGDEVDLRSRHDRPLARYFPELAAALRSLKESRVVLDGEIVIATTAGFDFEALLGRVHPAASRVERLARETPAALVVFDLLALGDEDLRERPFAERRRRLEELLEPAGGTLRLAPPEADAKEGSLDGPLRLTPA